jgi:hypothetical protein
VSSVAPASLSTTGGAIVTITGSGFGSTATVTLDGTAIAGIAATTTSVTFIAPIHAAGAAAFVVTSGGQSASGAVTFVAPSGANRPPVITNVRVLGPAAKPPSPFVDLTSSVSLVATVTDPEASPAALAYAWTVGAGTVSGSGASATWTLPASIAVTPSPVAATLTVTETYTENAIQHRHIVAATMTADAHDSATEILDKGFRFLDLFSQSSVPPATVMSDFSSSCDGAVKELGDVEKNRRDYLQLPGYTVTRLPPVTFDYHQSCLWTAFQDLREVDADACASFHVVWIVRAIRDVDDDGARIIPEGTIVTSPGRDFIGNIFQGGEWRLCSSDFHGEEDAALGLAAGESRMTLPDGTTRVIRTPHGAVPGRLRRRP